MKQDYATLRFLIVDEDEQFSNLLCLMLKDMGCTSVKIANSLQGAFAIMTDYTPDLLFIDIEIKHEEERNTGIGRLLRQHGLNCPLIFLVSHLKNYSQAQMKKLYPASFMNRELSLVKLLQALELATLQQENISLIEKLANAEMRSKMVRAKHNMPATPQLDSGMHVFFKVGDSYKRMDVEQISYFFADNKLTYARVGNRNYPTNVQLRNLEDILVPKFIRCHKKYLINVNKVESIQIKDNKLKIEDEVIAIGHSYRKIFFERLQILK